MKKFSLCLMAMLILLLLGIQASAAEKIRFGVPPWPGVQVKTSIVRQVLEELGYPTEEFQIGPPIIYKGLTTDEVDVFLGGWIPQHNSFLKPLLEKKEVEVLQTNLDNARVGLCVPKYVADAGVSSFADLDKHAEKFSRTIYNIEAGSSMHSLMEEIIVNDVAGLGDWTQVGSTTPAMLMQTKEIINNKGWVTFACWKPHWMNIDFDMVYLDPVSGTEEYSSNSKVYTVVSADMGKKYPQAYKFLKNVKISSETQSQWIMDYSKLGKPLDEVSSKWISTHKDLLAKWLDGVKASDGTDAMKKLAGIFK
ncbi:glycine betaine ABC transporter substrate-binding protein [Maridesulfovibrio frigidus]|uniref:glycine betaine ABC transporter substrate-binding protein n=1 Tax=Maridesulfovibrio frigidus TaxID=340956 RepID=UPI0004E115B2|nr:glycine betaine ABC transporter substrate-binding protein [Maridesulfovibrio frigidus]